MHATVARLVAEFTAADPVALRRAAGDRRALLIDELYAQLGTDAAVAAALPNRPSAQWAWAKRQDADAVRADAARYAAAMALGDASIQTQEPAAKLFSISMADVSSTVSQRLDGPYRKVVDVERIGDLYRVWLEPQPGEEGQEYIDGTAGSNLWQPYSPPTAAERELAERQDAAAGEDALEAAAADWDPPAAEVDEAELAYLRERGLA
jgi:hypothetical protein